MDAVDIVWAAIRRTAWQRGIKRPFSENVWRETSVRPTSLFIFRRPSMGHDKLEARGSSETI